MGGEILNSIARYLSRLEATQRDLQALFARKRDALRHSRPQELLQIAAEEAALVERLQQHIKDRERILASAAASGHAASSLKSLIESLGESATAELHRRVERAEAAAAELRRESWVQWIVAQRSYKQYSILLDRIANRGRPSPTYDRAQKTTGNNGALLDASV